MWDSNLFMTRDQIRKYDKLAIEELGIPGVVLMENAGRHAAEVAMTLCKSKRVGVVTGPGNNGGDGYVIARHLINEGLEVNTYITVPETKIKGDALINYKILKSMGAPVFDYSNPKHLLELKQNLLSDGFVVDALLGTGVSKKVEGHIADVIDLINDSLLPVLSVDIPSGLDTDTGRPWGRAVRAIATVTFGHMKKGLVLYPGAELCGELYVVPIGVPADISERARYEGAMLDSSRVKSLLPSRNPDVHKGVFGHLLVVAGSLGKTGAAAMVGRAAMRSGTGLVTIATTEVAQPVLEAKCCEAMVDHLVERTDAPLTEKNMRRVGRLLEGKKAIAVGPGLSTAPGISALLIKMLQMAEVPAVVDADGVNILAADPSGAGRITAPMVMTPHPGEMARLVNKTVANVQADRIGVAREAAAWHRVVMVLKGAHTVIAAPDGRVFVNPTGNPGMASAGMGDVLTGMIGGFLAQGLEPLSAAILGVYTHGLAADRVAARLSQTALIASDVIEELPCLFKEWGV